MISTTPPVKTSFGKLELRTPKTLVKTEMRPSTAYKTEKTDYSSRVQHIKQKINTMSKQIQQHNHHLIGSQKLTATAKQSRPCQKLQTYNQGKHFTPNTFSSNYRNKTCCTENGSKGPLRIESNFFIIPRVPSENSDQIPETSKNSDIKNDDPGVKSELNSGPNENVCIGQSCEKLDRTIASWNDVDMADVVHSDHTDETIRADNSAHKSCENIDTKALTEGPQKSEKLTCQSDQYRLRVELTGNLHISSSTIDDVVSACNGDFKIKYQSNSELGTKPEDKTDITSNTQRNDTLNSKAQNNGDLCFQSQENGDLSSKHQQNCDLQLKLEKTGDLYPNYQQNGNHSPQLQQNTEIGSKRQQNGYHSFITPHIGDPISKIPRNDVLNSKINGEFSLQPQNNFDLQTKHYQNDNGNNKSRLNSDLTEEIMEDENWYAFHMEEKLNGLHRPLHRTMKDKSQKKKEVLEKKVLWEETSGDIIEDIIDRVSAKVKNIEAHQKEITPRKPSCTKNKRQNKSTVSNFDEENYPQISRLLNKQDFSRTLQLLNQIHKLNGWVRGGTKRNRKEPIGVNCPMFTEKTVSDISSVNASGIGDMNYDQLVYCSVQKTTPRLHSHDRPSLDGSDTCVSERDILDEFYAGWAETQSLALESGDESDGLGMSETENPRPQKFVNTDYFDSFIDVRIFPDLYKLHIRTDVGISLVIVFLFLCVQYFFLTPFFFFCR